MRNLITGLLLLGSIFFVWNWQEKSDREAASIPQNAEVADLGALVSQASVGWDSVAPKARPFVPTEAVKQVEASASQDYGFSGMTAAEAATAYLEMNRSQWNLQVHHDMKQVVMQSPLGSSVKFEFSQDGVPITGMYINIQLGKNNEITSVENLYRPMEQADLRAPLLSAEDVSEKISQRFLSDRGAEASVMLFAGSHTTKPEPVYSMSATEVANDGQTRRPVKLLVRAVDGQIIDVTYERAEITN